MARDNRARVIPMKASDSFRNNGGHNAAYIHGDLPPHYPVPATEIDNALALPPERVSFLVKSMILDHYCK